MSQIVGRFSRVCTHMRGGEGINTARGKTDGHWAMWAQVPGQTYSNAEHPRPPNFHPLGESLHLRKAGAES